MSEPSPRRSGLVGLLAAGTISMVGTRMSTVALPWLVLVTTGSPTRMGLVAGAEMLPYVLTSALGPPLVDRLGARRISVATDLASAVVVATIAVSYTGGFAALVALVAIAGVLRGFGDNAKKALVHPATIEAGASTTRISSIYDGLNRLSILIGAPVAGVLIAWLGITATVLVDAASFAVAALVVAVLAPTRTGVRDDRADKPAREPYWVALRGGFQHLRHDRLTFGVLAMLLAINLFNQASVAVFIPLWVEEVLNTPAALGAVSGALALGAVVGNIGFTALATRLPRYLTFTAGFLVGGAPRFLVLAFSHELPLVVAVTFVSGLALSSVNPIFGAMMMERTPQQMQARVFGLSTAVAWAGIPLGGVLGGWAVSGFGLTTAVALAGALYFLVALTPVLGYQEWRKLDDLPSTVAAEPAPAKG